MQVQPSDFVPSFLQVPVGPHICHLSPASRDHLFCLLGNFRIYTKGSSKLRLHQRRGERFRQLDLLLQERQIRIGSLIIFLSVPATEQKIAAGTVPGVAAFPQSH